MMSGRVFIIGEAGVNHNGDINLAKQLIDVAYEAKVDAVKFQTFKPGELTGKFAFKVDYQEKTTAQDESRFEMSRKLALTYDHFRELKRYCDQKDVLFLSTPDGYESLDFLVDELDMPIIKISSTEMTHVQFLEACAKKHRPIILSTGLSTLDEVKRAVDIIRQQSQAELTILHCTTEYPAPYNDVNLKAMQTIAQECNVNVGYSDHTLGNQTCIAAVAMGAVVVEKHFTLDKNMEGPDHQASMDPQELAQFVNDIRIAETILGDGIKKPTSSELKNLEGVRRGIVAARDLSKGTVLSEKELTFKRPNTGIEPFDLDKVLGKTLVKDMQEDEVLTWDHIE